jgi:uroporphyrinogen decarboxylase
MSQPDRFLRACRGEPTDRVPVWFMRQAGRFQPEYRALRRSHSLLDIALTPRLAAEVTVRPVEAFGVDAAILFSDIMVPLGPAGVAYEIREGVGPVVADPIRTAAQVARIRVPDPARDQPETGEAVARSVERLGEVPLIAFAGAPFTLASYLVEGKPSRTYAETKRLMWGSPDVWDALMAVLADIVVAHLKAQLEAGAAAWQLFDSWVGALNRHDYVTRVLPQTRRIFDRLRPFGKPAIYFGVGTGHLLPDMASAGADVLGVDWREPVSEVRRRLGPRPALQGNLDPVALLVPWETTAARAREVLEPMAGQGGYIFNLGHGVLPETDPAQVRRLVELVHQEGVPRAT